MILLINPRFEVSYQPPLGLAYLAASLQAASAGEVRIIDTTFTPLQAALADAPEPAVVGVYVMAPYLRHAQRTVAEVRERFGDVPIVAGGPYPTVQPEEAIQRLGIRYVVRGEGERTFPELIGALRSGADPAAVAGVSYRPAPDAAVVHNADRPPVADLDALPFPARQLLPMDRYLRGGTQKAFSYRGIRATTMLTSRGCPYRCTYCQPTIDRLFGRVVRRRSAESILAEIEHLRRDYGVRGIFFVDDTFTCRRSAVLEFCDELHRRRLGVRLAINARVDTVDPELLAALKRAGGMTVMYGIESGNQRVLDDIHKRTTVKQIRQAVRWTHRAGLAVYGYFMIGSCEETPETIAQTFALARALPFDEVQFSMAAPYAGTYLHEQATALGLVADAESMETEGYFSRASMRSRHMSAEAIRCFHGRLDRYAKAKSLANLLRHSPGALPAVLANRVLPRWFARR